MLIDCHDLIATLKGCLFRRTPRPNIQDMQLGIGHNAKHGCRIQNGNLRAGSTGRSQKEHNREKAQMDT